jgi:hypothetical protein
MLVIAAMGQSSTGPTFWTLPTAMLSGTAAAGGIALINALGNLGGFFRGALPQQSNVCLVDAARYDRRTSIEESSRVLPS